MDAPLGYMYTRLGTPVLDNVFCALHGLPRHALLTGIARTATGKACNECKALGQMGLVCVEMLRHKCNFPKSQFFYYGGTN